MNLLNASKKIATDFAREEDGAQIVEYGMIIGAVSLVLIGLLASLGTGTNAFATMIAKVKNCLSNTAC